MPLTFSDEDGRKMRALQAQLTAILMRANDQHLEAAVAVFALIRCARILLDKYPPTARAALLDVVTAFLAHADVEEKSLILT